MRKLKRMARAQRTKNRRSLYPGSNQLPYHFGHVALGIEWGVVLE
jgi:hypothetical protein